MESNELEKYVKDFKSLPAENKLDIVMEAIKESERQKEIIKKELELFLGSDQWFTVGQAAKLLAFKNLGQNKLYCFMRERDMLYDKFIPYQEHVNAGYFKLVETRFTMPNGEAGIALKCVVSNKGLDFLRKKLIEAGCEQTKVENKNVGTVEPESQAN